MLERRFPEAVWQFSIEGRFCDKTKAQDKVLAAKLYTKETMREKLNCYKCGRKGRIATNCGTKMGCPYCNKKDHVSSRCGNNHKSCRFREDRSGRNQRKHSSGNNDEQSDSFGKEFALSLTAFIFPVSKKRQNISGLMTQVLRPIYAILRNLLKHFIII